MDLRRKVNFKKRIILFDGILILGGLTFSSSMSAFVGFMISSVLIVAISFFMRTGSEIMEVVITAMTGLDTWLASLWSA